METKKTIKIKPIYFCDKCDKKIITPRSLLNMVNNGNNIMGGINLTCSDEKCKHVNVIQKAPKNESNDKQ